MLFSKSNASLLLPAAGLALAVLVAAQQVPTYSVDVKVVNVLATVRDKHGAIVNNLSKDDFTLQEDGRPQAIRYFTRETDLPLTLGLLVDTSFSVRNELDKERSASGTFMDEVVREGKDAAFLIHFDHEVELLQDITSSRQKMNDALSLLQVQQPRRDDNAGSPGSGGGNPGGGGYPGGGHPGGGYPGGGGRYPRSGGGSGHGGHHGGGTLLYDSVYLASDELMQKRGRKAVIILSDGEDRGSKTSLDRAIESAQRANTIVYSIYFQGEQGGSFERRGMDGGFGGPWGRHGGGYPRYPQPQEQHTDGKKVLQRISKETGGRMFQVSKKETLDSIYQQIQDELRNQYSLGYTSDHANSGSEYRKIQVTTKQKDLVVQARDGYYPARQLASESKQQDR